MGQLRTSTAVQQQKHYYLWLQPMARVKSLAPLCTPEIASAITAA
jgi:hypothetical protein